MGHTGIRLGPLAFLLAVISICMTMLGILAIATANADLRIAGKYADMVKIRYELEAEGHIFLSEAGTFAEAGAALYLLPDTETDTDGVTRKVIRREDWRLHAGIRLDEAGKIEIVSWRIDRAWEPEPGMGDLWNGQ